MNSQAAAFLAVGIILGGGLAFGVALISQGATSTSTGITNPANQASTVEGEVLLEAPFNGTVVNVSVNTTIATVRSSHFSEPLFAQYLPVANSSTARYAGHYFGSFDVASISDTPLTGEEVALTVSYGSHSETGSVNVSAFGRGGRVVIPLSLDTVLQTGGPVELSTSDGPSVCPNVLGGVWSGGFAESCAVENTLYVDYSLTIGSGVRLEEFGGIYVNNTVNNLGTIDIINYYGFITNVGTVNNNGTITNDGTVNNYGLIVNDGTVNNDGLFSNPGTLGNNGTLNNVATAGVDRSGELDNPGNIRNGGTINNIGEIYSKVLYNYGIISNQYFIANLGTFIDECNSQYSGQSPAGNPVQRGC